ncbi:MAG: hypothetical protein OJF47_000055 [Nitrospira sp.]|jgi:hypothetical protein|nr:MAG: hypothetical protein OJF47_000055 [Nitrospira sp.]
MSFTPLKDRLNGLPLVLAGPIVRRVEPTGATAWVALRRPRRIRLEVYDGDAPGGPVVASGERDTVPVGSNLHIACVTAKPGTPFTAGKPYQYNLTFDHSGGSDDIPNGSDLLAPRIVAATSDEARAKLTYAGDGGPARPSFVLPPASLDDLRLLHGSCRKIAGEHSDALEAADHILRQAFRGNDRRPHMLFLTGDNIYNDGCERACFEVVLDAAATLLGWDETMPGVDKKISEMSGVRWEYALDDAGLSNTGPWPSLRHLFGIGESLALHLLAFADSLWPDDLDYQKKAFDFRGTLPAVRRAFANIATYMIFDDHELSNSWNITAEWVESVLAKPMGRRVYQDALAAYALCQGWGNTPDRYETGPGQALLTAVSDWSQAERAGTVSPAEPLARLINHLGLPGEDDFKSGRDWARFHGPDVIRWDYTVPCPGLSIVVLDTYMWRSYPDKFRNASILSEGGLREQIDRAAYPETECSLIVVSNVAIELPGISTGELVASEWHSGVVRLILWLHPIFLLLQLLRLAIKLLTLFQLQLPSLFSFLRLQDYGPEYGAKYEPQTTGFEQLMAHAMHRAPHLVGGKRQTRVVILSGDVHRSFCMRMQYWSRTPFGVTADPVEGVVAQLVSSPCKWVNPTVVPLKDERIRHWAGWKDKPALTWISEPNTSPWRFKQSPWMMEYQPGAREPKMNPAPEWRYTLEPVAPDRPADHTPFVVPDRAQPTLDDQLDEMALVAPETLWTVEKSHVIKANNIGDVTFEWTAGNKAVVQNVWWRGRPTIDPNWTVNRFVVSMDPQTTPPALPT